jgi:hypothetical protein
LNASVVVTRPSIRNLSLAGLVVLGAGALAIMVWRLSDTLRGTAERASPRLEAAGA